MGAKWRKIPSRIKRKNNHNIRYLDVGWGGRIRTSEWRNQNPLPYHLATPQNAVGWAWAAGIGPRRRPCGGAHHNDAPPDDQRRAGRPAFTASPYYNVSRPLKDRFGPRFRPGPIGLPNEGLDDRSGADR